MDTCIDGMENHYIKEFKVGHGAKKVIKRESLTFELGSPLFWHQLDVLWFCACDKQQVQAEICVSQ